MLTQWQRAMGALSVPPPRRLLIDVLQVAELASRDVPRVGQERCAGVSLPGRAAAGSRHCRQSVSLRPETRVLQCADGLDQRLPTDVERLGPNVLAFPHPDGFANVSGELAVIGLRQARANHPEGAEAPVQQPVQRLDALGHLGCPLFNRTCDLVVKRAG